MQVRLLLLVLFFRAYWQTDEKIRRTVYLIFSDGIITMFLSVILKEQSTNTQKSGRIKMIKPERENDYEVQ